MGELAGLAPGRQCERRAWLGLDGGKSALPTLWGPGLGRACHRLLQGPG